MRTNITRIPLPVSTPILPPPQAHPALPIPEVGPYPPLQLTKDTRDNLKASILLPRSPKMSANLLHDQVLPWQPMPELKDNRDMVL